MVWIRGVELNLHPEGEALSDHIRREHDFFEAEILDYMRDNFPVHGTIIDIGANIGNHSLYFAKFLDYRQILSFEPVPENYVLLAMNVGYYPAVYPFRLAISNEFGHVRIEPNKGNMGASEVRPNGSLEVIAITLDMFAVYDCSLLKIDVEWHEPEVLLGGYKTIEKNKPLILIEDANKEYAKLLPDYDCIMEWEHHKSYLYKWRNI